MCVTLALQNWIVVYPEVMNNDVRHFVQEIKTVGEAQNFNVSAPHL